MRLSVIYISWYIFPRMLWAILNKSWRQHPTKQQLYGHLPPIMKTIQVRQTKHVGYCWKSKDVLISDILMWTPSYGCAKEGPPARTYIQQLCADIGCSLEDLPGAMDDREGWRERVREIYAGGTTSWWWYCLMHNWCIKSKFLKKMKIFSWLSKSLFKMADPKRQQTKIFVTQTFWIADFHHIWDPK